MIVNVDVILSKTSVGQDGSEFPSYTTVVNCEHDSNARIIIPPEVSLTKISSGRALRLLQVVQRAGIMRTHIGKAIRNGKNDTADDRKRRSRWRRECRAEPQRQMPTMKA